jgi:hypothetical protein
MTTLKLKTLKLKFPPCFHNVVIAGHPTVEQLCAILGNMYISASPDETSRQMQTCLAARQKQFCSYSLGGKKRVAFNPAAARALSSFFNFYTKLNKQL